MMRENVSRELSNTQATRGIQTWRVAFRIEVDHLTRSTLCPSQAKTQAVITVQ